ncbi:hypothetical protein JOF53_005140 [Crossiella equi]|uniref:Integral membrane protein n=1 Tax=Crossiella equi TaxID=130796 RepID=A0ABS5AI64_9PSEU|nr:DUF6350 family protein [Crossiella equi]MBP2476268.1 hypothetical protein [Crossiella equi]
MTVLGTTAHGSASPPGAAAPPATPAQQVRAALAVALGVIALGYLACAGLVALVMATAERAVVTAEVVSAAAAPLWLAAHHVPLLVRGTALGVLPLLPTVLVFLLVRNAARGTARRLRLSRPADAVRVVATVGTAHVVVGGLLAALVDPPFGASPASGAVACGLLSAVAATSGVAHRCGLLLLAYRRFGSGVFAGLRAARIALAALCAAGALIVVLALALSFESVRADFAELAPGFGNGLGLTLVCLLYLPNAVVAGLSFVAGAGFTFGEVAVSPLRVVAGLEPPFPLLATFPESGTRLWLIGLLLPVGVGVLLGWVCRRSDPQPQARLLVVAVASAVVAASAFLAASLVGGTLGPISFRVPAGALAVALFVWTAAPGCLVAWLAGPREETEDEDEDLAEGEAETEADGDAEADEEADPEAEDGTEDDEPVDEAEAADADGPAEEPEPVDEAEPEAEPEPGDEPDQEPEVEEDPVPRPAEEDFVAEDELEEALLADLDRPGRPDKQA